MNTNKGFTLVELLVVVTIISVLAAMLLPVLENAVSQARVGSCSNNLHQQGVSFSLYADEYNGWWPYGRI